MNFGGVGMFKIIKQALLSGIMVGIGVSVQLQADNKYAGAMLFSLALLVIIECELKLYTGKIGFFKISEAGNLAVMLVFNFIGSLIPVSICTFKDGFFEKLRGVADVKFSQGYFQLFLFGLLCGVLMLIAVYCKKPLITVFCIMTFILSGYEHCVADFPYLVFSFSAENALGLLCVVLGNSLGSVAAYRLVKE